MPEPWRAAVYYAPERDDPLWARGCAWLGRDPEGAPVVPPDIPGLAGMTSAPRRYGFHATLKPPMRLAHGLQALLASVAMLAARTQPFTLPALDVVEIGRFAALCPASESAALNALAAACVTGLDDHRVPETGAERGRRASGRTPRQLEYLHRFGYPLVLDEWRFHMTLSNGGDGAGLVAPARDWFSTSLHKPRQVASLCIFIEPAPGADFVLSHRIPLAA